jgi:LysM repeat protein
MTSIPDRESSTPDREPAATSDPGTICPYLLVATGRWRNAEPSREHVCAAQAEVVPVGLETQRRLCFGDHAACGRYQAALEAYRAAVPLVPLRPVARTTPVVVDRGRAPLPLPHVGDRRTLGQAILALAMVAAVGAVLVARLGPSGGVAGATASPAVASPSIAAAVTPSPTPVSTPSPTATVSPTPSPSPSRTPKPSRSPKPSASQTYTVKPGDTLSSIAAKFGTTVKALMKLNAIKDPTVIRPGQVLKIP